MKKILTLTVLSAALLLCACTVTRITPGGSASPAPSDVTLPGVPGVTAQTSEPSEAPSASQFKSNLYDPSIFVIEASGEERQELAAGFYADMEFEIYLHKIDSNDNRAVAGSYQGVFWMSVALDTQEFASDLTGDAPIDITFDAGAESVCDNLAISLNTTDDKAWVDYSITGEDGNSLPLTQDTPVAKGSFVAVAKGVYLEAHASGTQGEKVDYSDAADGELIDVNYVIHVEPDDMESGGQRKVVINLSGEGFDVTLDGVMRRLPGYPQDVSDYLNSGYQQNSAWSHFQ